jgi:PAS domain S-box-containing protein
VETSGDAIYIYDFAGTILTWNRAAEELYGYPAREVVGRHAGIIFPSDRNAEREGLLNAAASAGKVIRNFETTRVHRDGSSLTVLLSVSPICDAAGRPVALAVIARDITDQKRHEESLREIQKLESLGLLAGGIAHDFNNLLTGVLGNASLLAEEFPATAPQSQIVQALVEAGERMARLTAQMLAYSGRGHFIIEAVDLSRQVVQITSLIQAAIPRNVELRLVLANNLPLIEADTTQLQQIIMNLVINAAEAVGDRNGTVAVRTGVERIGEAQLHADVTRGDPPPGEYVALCVQDTGCGMDEQTRRRIFDPFFTTKFTGRGLGLSSVLGIVRGHKGLLTVDSCPGLGSTFRVFFPVSSRRRVEDPARPRQARGSGTVLVVDDEEVVRNVATTGLHRLGYTVVTAVNGREAVDRFAADPDAIDVVLLDMMMPVMSGEQALEAMLALKPGAAIVGMSGFDEREAKQRFGGRIGLFVQKPFTATRLGAAIEAARRQSLQPLENPG